MLSFARLAVAIRGPKWVRNLTFLTVVLALGQSVSAQVGEAAPPKPRFPFPEKGIAAKYPGDQGIAKDPQVIGSSRKRRLRKR
jgi:hypothetical protein